MRLLYTSEILFSYSTLVSLFDFIYKFFIFLNRITYYIEFIFVVSLMLIAISAERKKRDLPEFSQNDVPHRQYLISKRCLFFLFILFLFIFFSLFCERSRAYSGGFEANRPAQVFCKSCVWPIADERTIRLRHYLNVRIKRTSDKYVLCVYIVYISWCEFFDSKIRFMWEFCDIKR